MSLINRLGPPSAHVNQLVDALRRGGPWWPVGQELLAQQVPIADDSFVARLAELLDHAFYASMTTEEAQRAKFSIAVAKPTDFRGHGFEQPKELTVELLRKLSAACSDDGAAIFVWFEAERWFVLGEQLWVAELVKAALPAVAPDRIGMHHLVAIQRAMRRHGRGGALLVVAVTPENVEVGYPIRPSEAMRQVFGDKLGEVARGTAGTCGDVGSVVSPRDCQG